MLTEQLGGEVSPGEAGSQKIRAIELKSAVSWSSRINPELQQLQAQDTIKEVWPRKVPKLKKVNGFTRDKTSYFQITSINGPSSLDTSS